MLFDSWMELLRTAVTGVVAYTALVAILRVSGKRTLSKMNAFDLVVTVALGSTLATVLLSKDVALAEGILALGLLVGLQYVIAWLSVRSPRVSRIVKSEPSLLLYRGRFLSERMRKERVTEEEVRSAVRAGGHASVEAVEAVVLETDGTFTVVTPPRDGRASALSGVKGPASGSQVSAGDPARGA